MTQQASTPDALRLADWCDENSSGAYRQSAEAAAELRRQHAEMERLRADAARYRWLTGGEWIGEHWRAAFDKWDGCDGKAGFDVAIDAAMRAASPNTGEPT